MKIAIANDHAALDLKLALKQHMEQRGHEVWDFGTDTCARVEYPAYAEKLARAVADGEADCGVLLCGTGIGMSIAANKVRGIRAAACSEPYSAMLSKQHNNSNILTMGARVVGEDLAKMILDSWLTAEFMGGRHAERVAMIAKIEEAGCGCG